MPGVAMQVVYDGEFQTHQTSARDMLHNITENINKRFQIIINDVIKTKTKIINK